MRRDRDVRVMARELYVPDAGLERPSAATGAGSVRPATVESRRAAVERVLTTMRARYAEPLTLAEFAAEAFLSPYHFNRVFRHTTGVPPGRFLAALRMQTAKRLLLTTELRVTDVCFEVGYLSLGTFTTHFRQLVGLGPCRLRRLASEFGDVPLEALCDDASEPAGDASLARVRLRVPADERRAEVVFVGLFPTPLPQSRPVSCAVSALPAAPALACRERGPHYALASAYDGSIEVLGALLAGDDEVRVGVAGPLLLGEPGSSTAVAVPLRRLDVVDPPILLALPLVLAEATAPRRERARPRRRSLARAASR
jgi:AraC family transcriptional regulator